MTLMACPECDLLHRQAPVRDRASAVCVRCGAVLKRGRRSPLDTTLALALTAMVLFVLANAFPLLTMQLHGLAQAATLPGCVQALATDGWIWLALIIAITVQLAPLAHLAGVSYVLIQIRRGKATHTTARIFRQVLRLERWGMAEVFVLGILISYVKLSKMAPILPGPSLYALLGFIMIAAAELSSLDPATVWDALEHQA